MDKKEKQKEFIYFPSLSAGGFASALIKDEKLSSGVPCRFYSDEYPEAFRHKYFLVTAGHYYKKMDIRAQMGLGDDVLVFGDSGGYQIATGALKYSDDLREKIFHWLEANSDVAANLDIPPKTVYENQFEKCAEISYDNFAWFEKHQSGKTKFLNMLQGSNPNEYDWWYHKFKHFEFSGWAIGGPQKLVDFMWALALMLKNREFEKTNLEYLHLLGISKISDFFILSTIQKLLNKHYGNRIVVTTDSSSPGQYPVYGTFLHSHNFKKLSFTDVYMPKPDKDKDGNMIPLSESKIPDLQPDLLVPDSLGDPACQDFTWGMLDNYNKEAVPRMVLHNVHVFQNTIQEVNKIVAAHRDVAQYVVPNNLAAVLKSIYEMFEDPDKAITTYEKYKQYYRKFGGQSITTINKDIFNQFFEEKAK
jgi:hypothetical protein